jgi:dipeptidyl aminopeptidase/acylaminoacyl peptidase
VAEGARALRLVVAGVAFAAVLGWPASAAAVEQHERILFVQGNANTHVRSVSPGGGPGRPLIEPAFGVMSPDWSPDGTQIAFVSSIGGSPDIYVMNADGSGIRTFAASRRGEGYPAWSPDGGRIAYTNENRLYVRSVENGATRRLDAAGIAIHQPSWSPDGNRIVYSVDRADQTAHIRVVPARGGRPRALTSGNVRDVDPAWSPGGRFIAFIRHQDPFSPFRHLWIMGADGSAAHPLLADAESHGSPAWSPSGGRIAFSRGLEAAAELYTVALDGTRLRRLTVNAVADDEPDWADVPASRQRLPDLDQRAPTGLELLSSNGRFKLGFTSATDNIGLGPIWIRAVRSGPRADMEARQVIRFADGVRLLRRVGLMRFATSDSHRHWHLLRFQSYELRRAGDFRVVIRDRKSGFCLLDRWGRALARIPWRPPPRFVGNCAQRRPAARRVEHGTSAGYTDLYPAHFHGQNLDVTGVRAGRYWLVHRANPTGRLRELNYENNAAAVLIRLRWPNGRRSAPAVRTLRVCPRAERC